MKMQQTFNVDAPVDAVWQALADVERIAPCLPGAQLTESPEEGVFLGTFSVKLGPATAAYRGRLELQSLDADTRTATMHASGEDKRGQGSARATILSRATPDGDGTRVEVETDMTITGRLARYGRGGMIEDVSNRLLSDFAKCLQAQLQRPAGSAASDTAGPSAAGAGALGADGGAVPPSPAGGVNGLALLWSVLRGRLRRLFGRAGTRTT